jgi:hypothetical protein
VTAQSRLCGNGDGRALVRNCQRIRPGGPTRTRNVFKRNKHEKTYRNQHLCGWGLDVVEDVTMDVKSANPLNYDNTGIQTLCNVVGPLGLIDIHVRREQLHNKYEYTRGGNTRNGYTSTRIDRWYVPDIDELITTAGTTNEFVYKDKPSDHQGICQAPDRGSAGKNRNGPSL